MDRRLVLAGLAATAASPALAQTSDVARSDAQIALAELAKISAREPRTEMWVIERVAGPLPAPGDRQPYHANTARFWLMNSGTESGGLPVILSTASLVPAKMPSR
jgi:hypothetical protein